MHRRHPYEIFSGKEIIYFLSNVCIFLQLLSKQITLYASTGNANTNEGGISHQFRLKGHTFHWLDWSGICCSSATLCERCLRSTEKQFLLISSYGACFLGFFLAWKNLLLFLAITRQSRVTDVNVHDTRHTAILKCCAMF